MSGRSAIPAGCVDLKRPPAPPAPLAARRVLDFLGLSSYNAPPITITIARPIAPPARGRSGCRETRGHGGTLAIQEHHAPQGAAGSGELEARFQAHARNHRRLESTTSRALHSYAT